MEAPKVCSVSNELLNPPTHPPDRLENQADCDTKRVCSSTYPGYSEFLPIGRGGEDAATIQISVEPRILESKNTATCAMMTSK